MDLWLGLEIVAKDLRSRNYVHFHTPKGHKIDL